jgi:hypothetical protein
MALHAHESPADQKYSRWLQFRDIVSLHGRKRQHQQQQQQQQGIAL